MRTLLQCVSGHVRKDKGSDTANEQDRNKEGFIKINSDSNTTQKVIF